MKGNVYGNIWVVEYSPSRGEFKVTPLEAALALNRSRFIDCPKLIDDWMFIHCAGMESCNRIKSASEHYLQHWGEELKWESKVN